MTADPKDTLNLPKTDFAMRAGLVEKEPARIEFWESIRLYQKIQEKNKSGTKYVLHDGPPFTNGDVHIGTALNKILKDTTLKYKSMRGYQTPFVPGWDCHGLPIEYKVTKDLHEKKKSGSPKTSNTSDTILPPIDPLELRKACAEFSQSYIEKQKGQFRRLGVLADWNHIYKTMNPTYEADILRTLAKFVEKKLIYRSKKPVYWSIPCETALAEAEIEYKEHTSPSIYVKFPLPPPEAEKLGLNITASSTTQKLKPQSVSVVIWTTTPWTLPANLAISVHADLDYQAITINNETYIIAQKRIEHFLQTCLPSCTLPTLGKIFKGHQLEGLKCMHPFINRHSLILLGDHVTLESGTGCVHTAPGHGTEDYLIGLKYGLDIYSPLDDQARYMNDGQIPPELVGKSVLETESGHSPANKAVIELLKSKNALIHIEDYVHSYPHCWRSKTPVIFRAVPQWFVKLNSETGIRQKAIEKINELDWSISDGQKRLVSAVENRPDWCISRQRSWGTPLPVFYDEEGNILLDAKIILALADKFEKQGGSDLWFKASAEELLEGIPPPPSFQGKKLKKSTDTIDVWIDSGCSHRAVLQKDPLLHWPADLYFEGSDQHRGWFQSSLLTGIIADEKAPFKRIVTHGYVVNEERKKISKSDKKPQTADSYVNTYGADIIRLWVASEDFRKDITVSDNIINNTVQTYRTLRNTLRFQLGNLYDFDFKQHEVAYKNMTPLEKWALHHTTLLLQSVTEAFDNFQYHKGYQLMSRYFSNTLSATYHDILKDRLYTYAPNWPQRRSAQTAIHFIFNLLVRVLAPILCFTTDEAYAHLQNSTEFSPTSIHLENWPEAKKEWLNPEIAQEFEQLFTIRTLVNEKLEIARQNKLIGAPLDASVTIKTLSTTPVHTLLQKYSDFLSEFFIVSQVRLESGVEDVTNISIQRAEGQTCERCWRCVPQTLSTETFKDICPRCRDALLEKFPKQ